MASIRTMIEQLDGILATRRALTEWENDFVTNILERYLATKKDTRNLSAKQIEIVERIWSKHFAA